MSVYILVVDDEPDVEALFRQQFRRDLRAGRFLMEFAPSAPVALARAAEIRDPLILIPGTSICPDERAGDVTDGAGAAAGRPCHHDHGLWRR
jgi:hypothetical protein